ncbi:protein translocase subunit SecF [Rarobacter faecitabidus]|uniref:Protein-export membrane protein SecF n=1 Tax=Rarobacter faecitabidus TaxID=13243 RepID=A0A542ZV52_RARFA|nr:protein translocase subunit SecF [Rarobacter faecitabidus]TQL64222.1 protein translocase subunit secF [Rarobacter faecitabidus]
MSKLRNFSTWSNDLYTGARSYDIIGKRRRYYVASIAAVLLCVLVVILRGGFNLGIDFKGGVEFTVSGASSTSQEIGIDAVQSIIPEEVPRVANVGSSAVRIQTSSIDEDTQDKVQQALADAYGVNLSEVSKSSIGPSWGSDVSGKALQGMIGFIILVSLVMVIYFRSWQLATSAVISLLHDLAITAGVYAAVGWEITPATVIGFLTIAAYSVYDKVVVFDKIRENTSEILEQSRTTYAEQSNLAVNQTLVRSINTSILGLLPVSSILFIGAFILGAGTLRDLALALFVGMAVGAYSSIFLAPPLDATLRGLSAKYKAHERSVFALRERVATSDAVTVDDLLLAGGADVHLVPGRHLGTGSQPRKRRKK